jgi:hypothetical protein
MPLPASSPSPELALDERATAEHDMERDTEVDPWSTGYIVFSLGPNFEDATYD